jgi:hypothetical protein
MRAFLTLGLAAMLAASPALAQDTGPSVAGG